VTVELKSPFEHTTFFQTVKKVVAAKEAFNEMQKISRKTTSENTELGLK